MHYQFDWSAIAYPRLWLHAILITIVYAGSTIALGLAIGLVLGILGTWSRFYVDRITAFGIQIFRCTPLLVQVVWFYYALPILTGLSLSPWIAAGLGLTLYMAAFSAEIFRGGILSIERGQWNAAHALGMGYGQVMRRVILPQAIRRIIPPLVNQSITQLKNTSLLYVVAIPDLMYTSYELTARTYRPLEVYTFVGLVYFVILYPVTLLAKRLEPKRGRSS